MCALQIFIIIIIKDQCIPRIKTLQIVPLLFALDNETANIIVTWVLISIFWAFKNARIWPLCIQTSFYSFSATFLFQCGDVPVTTEALLTIVKVCSSIEELDAVIEILDNEIHKQRSRDANRPYKDG